MSNESLYKLFHSNYQEYNKEYEKRFNSDDTIKFDILIGNNPAFFCPSINIYNLLLTIERTDKKINNLYNLLPAMAIRQFETRCLIDEIVLTNNIEGVYSTRKEINEVLSSLSNHDKNKRFYGLVKKYLLLVQNKDIEIKTCKDIRNLYDDLFIDEIKSTDINNIPDGELFRKESVSVFSATQKEIHKGLYPESKIIEAMEMSLVILKDENLEPLIKIAIFHYLFGYIHPFYDGNGRTSRFISSYLLTKVLNNLIGYRISFTIKEHIKEYYEAFKICNHTNNKGELTPFVEMFLHIINESQTQLYNALSKRVNALKYYETLLQKNINKPKIFDLYYILVQASLFSEYGISSNDLMNYLSISFNTLKKYLNEIPNDILIKQTQCRNIYYQFNLDNLNTFLNSNL